MLVSTLARMVATGVRVAGRSDLRRREGAMYDDLLRFFGGLIHLWPGQDMLQSG